MLLNTTKSKPGIVPILVLLSLLTLSLCLLLSKRTLSSSNVSTKSKSKRTRIKYPKLKIKSIQQRNKKNKKYKTQIEVVSIGSLGRPENILSQSQTWGKHASVKYFWGLTELDDDDPYCSINLNITDYHNTCQYGNPWNETPSVSHISQFFRERHFPLPKMQSAGPGWICAQRRTGQAIGRKGFELKQRLLFENKGLPDYLIIVDDDTYMNLDYMVPYLKTHVPTSTARVYAGCMRYLDNTKRKYNMIWSYPWGGFGTIFPRASIERLIMPLYCKTKKFRDRNSFMSRVCRRILQDNLMGERELFIDGMSISDLAYAMSTREYFCMHSDHLQAYLIQYYYLSEVDIKEFKKRKRDRKKSKNKHVQNSTTYLKSKIHEYMNNEQCTFNGKKIDSCIPESHICHKLGPYEIKYAYYKYSLDKKTK